MKIGIFLAYAPGIPMSNQGLGRQLVQFTAGFYSHSAEPVAILCPSWLHDDVRQLMAQGGVPAAGYSIVSPPGGIPVSFRMQRFLSERSRPRLRTPRWRRLLRASSVVFGGAKAQLRRVAVYLLSTRSVAGFILTALLLSVAAIFSLPLVLPLLALAIGLLVLRRAVRKVGAGLAELFSRVPIINQVNGFLRDIRLANRSVLIQRAYNSVYRRETTWMVDFANKDDSIEFWFSPTVYWPEFNDITKPSALCFPDMVLSEFPVSFAVDHPSSLTAFSKCEKTIEGGKHFITYSDITARDSLERRFGVHRDQISVIPHAAMDLSRHISIAGTLDPQQAKRRFAINLIEGHRNVHWHAHRYLRNFSFENTRYLLYPSQIRPNKNIINLIRGYEISLRKKYQYVKLILTGDISSNTEISNFIHSRRLQYDIISFHDVPEQVLAALYHLAELVVTPTLYEGGFPFTFTEGLSVGTPSIMSDIPQVRRTIPGELVSEMLFDPYSPESIADAIVRGLAHRERFVELQMPLYQRLRQRTWSDVASDHVAAFSKIRQSTINK